LRTQEDLELAIETLTKIIHQAANQSTSPLEPQQRFNNIPLEIKQLLKEKRKHRAHIPADKT
jgi:ribosome recycling factor